MAAHLLHGPYCAKPVTIDIIIKALLFDKCDQNQIKDADTIQ